MPVAKKTFGYGSVIQSFRLRKIPNVGKRVRKVITFMTRIHISKFFEFLSQPQKWLKNKQDSGYVSVKKRLTLNQLTTEDFSTVA